MLNEKYRQNNNDDNSTLRTALKGAAIAGGVGLAMAYQPWGRRATRFLGRVVDTTKNTFKSMERIRQGGSVRYYTKSDYRKLYDEVRANWTNSAANADRVRFNTKSNGSLAAYIQSVEVMVSQAQQKAQNAWLHDYVHKDALEQLERQGFDRNTASNVRSFLAKAVSNAHNFGRNMELARQHKLDGQALSFAEQISRDIQVRWDNAIKKKTGSDADIIQKLSDSIAKEIKKYAYNIDTMERALGTARKKTAADYAMTAMSHAHKMTWEETIKLGSAVENAYYTKEKNSVAVKDTMQDIERFVRDTQGDDAFKRLMQITVDQHNLFVTREGNPFSKELSGQIWLDFLRWSRNTLPGKLFKVGDIDNAMRLPATQMIRLSADDPTLRAKLKEMGEEDKYHIRIGKDIYSLDMARDEGSRMYLNPELNNGDIRFVSGKYGFYHTQIEALSGKTKTSISDNWLFRKLDIFQDREEYSGNLIANKLSMFMGKNGRAERFGEQLNMSPEYEERWRQTIFELNSIANDPNADFLTDLSEESKDFILEYMETQRKISDIFRSSTYKLESGAINEILSSSKLNGYSKRLFETLQTDDDQAILKALVGPTGARRLKIKTATGHTINFLNSDLRRLIESVKDDPELAMSNISLVTNEMGLSYGSDLINLFRAPMGNTTYTFGDILRREVAKEALLRQGLEEGVPLVNDTVKYERINELLKDLNLTDRNRRDVERLAQFGIWQKFTKINESSGIDEMLYLNYYERMMNTHKLLRGTDETAKEFQKVYTTTMDDEISWLEEQMSSEAPGVGSLDDYVAVNRSASPLDIVQGLNRAIFFRDTFKIKADVMNIVRGLSAGRDDMSGANLYTFVPFFAFKRLSDELNRVGLGFSSESTKSTMDLAMSFMTKRVLPIAVGATYLDFFDDVSRETTGTGLWEAFTAGVANVDLAGRRVISGLGMDPWLKQLKAVNPIWQYWGDKDEYQGYEERVRYYQKGYTPVRKAAWWTWGGVSEARGGEIQYWEPNIVRRASSNAYDAVMYDSLWDKWSHSLIPTPLNPLSPLFAILDPYYMERAHSEDRPYVLSGPMFTEGTPWGAVLNPTIGAFIKPEKELHDFRFDNGIDIVSLLHNANESIRERARDFTRTHYISVKGGQVSAVDWNSYNAPTPDTRVETVRTNGGLIGINTGIYGVYGDGSRGYGLGSAGGSAMGAYAVHNLGRAPGGGYEQNVSAGFNPFSEEMNLNKHILAHPDPLSVSEIIRASLFGNRDYYVRHGEITVNENGELGIYQNRPITKPRGAFFTVKENLAIDAVTSKYTQDDRMAVFNLVNDNVPLSIMRGLNKDLIKKSKQHVDSPYAIDEDAGFTANEKLSSFNPSKAMDLLNDADAVSDLLNQGNGSDFVRNATTSMRLIGGIYGYMGSELVGLGVHEDKILANSSDMYAFNRTFWDLNLGGFGGAVSEIGRRFIPNFQRLSKVNPLMNEMPDWLPERFRYGDPFSMIPKGEMRLPGKGYETLNELHPDQFSTEKDRYGAFDRFKILADIAPNSPEYKLWREIAKKTVTDPELLEEMEEIKERARQQGKKHDFYNYQIVGKELDYRPVVVSEVLGYGKFRSGNTIYKMAGITVQGNAEENAQEVLNRYLKPGQKVIVGVDTNQAYAQNKDAQKTLNAAVYVNGESVNQLMLEAGDAKERKGDKSAAATIGQLSGLQYGIALASEIIGHLDIPIISDQWLRIRSPYETYLAEEVYGTSYQSWAHPINTFLYPAIERAVHERSIGDLLLFDAFSYVQEHGRLPAVNTRLFGVPLKIGGDHIPRGPKHLFYMASILGNRATLVGHAVGNMIDAGNAKLATSISMGLNLAVTSAHMITGGSSMFDMAALGAYTGNEIARINEVTGKYARGKYAVIGAVAAMGYRALHSAIVGEWKPDRQKKKWDMQEYWDRLNYIKWQGLYEEAARRALDEEDVDVEQFLKNTEEKEEKRKITIEKLKNIKESLNEAYGYKTNYLKNYLLKLVNSRISELQPSESMVEGGKYTQSAIIYKRAAEATIYGLKKGASWSSIVSALPTNDREYFMEFVAETDKSKRDKILAIVSPSLKKALQMSWGMKPDKQESNKDFFKDHYLPDSDWEGWNPDIDLNDIAVKTIANEAMNLSDFGFYESALREPEVQAVTPLPYNKENDDISISSELRSLLKGKGLRNVEVNVTAKNTMGPTDIIANIAVWAGLKEQQRKVEDSARAWI